MNNRYIKETDSNSMRTLSNFDDDSAWPVLYLQLVSPVKDFATLAVF